MQGKEHNQFFGEKNARKGYFAFPCCLYLFFKRALRHVLNFFCGMFFFAREKDKIFAQWEKFRISLRVRALHTCKGYQFFSHVFLYDTAKKLKHVFFLLRFVPTTKKILFSHETKSFVPLARIFFSLKKKNTTYRANTLFDLTIFFFFSFF